MNPKTLNSERKMKVLLNLDEPSSRVLASSFEACTTDSEFMLNLLL
jgi:hypothetical protein